MELISCTIQSGLNLLDSSFIELIVATFLGFGSALLVEAIIDRNRKKGLKKQLLKDLKKELLSIHKVMEAMEANKVFIRPYAIPVWTGAKECGELLCMDSEAYFSKLLEVFSSIEEANLVEMKCFELYVGQKQSVDMEMIYSALADNRVYIREQIDIGLSIIEECASSALEI